MRMRHRSERLLLAGSLLCLLPLIGVASEAPKAAETCVDCHGENGVSTDGEIPTIAGASDFFLENQLIIYREEARPCAAEEFGEAEHDDVDAEDHCALAKGLSESEVADLATHFAGQTFSPADQPIDQALADKGASIHKRSCDKCHAEGGSLKLDDAGILAGQWKPYLLKQLRHYKAGERWQPEKMEPEMKKLSEEDMKALAEYYAGQGSEQFP